MRYAIFSIFDTAAQAFAQPFYSPSEQVAVRSCSDMVNDVSDKRQMPAQHPEDFELYELGSFEDGEGKISVSPEPRLVARFKDLLKKVQ